MPFREFTAPTGDRTYSAQLQEWSEHVKIPLRLSVTSSRLPNGSPVTTCVPTINGQEYPEYSASGPTKSDAKNKCAGLVIASGLPGSLRRG
ncbi:hypothetical protein FRC12_014277 [Ceratobasidium sp. 428]|nr:hypothetical protein FRC12_014277 [Ceratobasidium sp. 428]